MRLRPTARILVLSGGALLAASLVGCGPGPDKADQKAASRDLKSAGDELKAAVDHTGRALSREADAAKPDLKDLGRQADLGAAKLADAAGAVAAKAGAGLDEAGAKTDAAAHRAARDARDHAAAAGDQ